MLNQKSVATRLPAGRAWRQSVLSLALTLLAIELLDEIVFGTREAAWPLVRNDFRLSYAEVGLLLGLPGIFGNLIEPLIGILADVWKRRVLILGGGIVFTIGLLLIAVSNSFALLLLAFIILNPSSGAFVGLAQAALMDSAPSERERNMARWAVAGSLGTVCGPVALTLALMLGAGWRAVCGSLALVSILLVLSAWRFPFETPVVQPVDERETKATLRDGVRGAWRALRRKEVLRWLILLELIDLMLDGLHGYLALYFADVVGMGESRAALSLIVWTGAGLAGGLLMLPLLKRMRGLSYLRLSAVLTLLLFPVFLLAQGVAMKLALLGLIGVANAGWYPVLKAQLYKAMEGQSGTVMTLGNLGGVFNSLIPLGLGLIAERFGLATAMWLLIFAPVALLFGVPRERD